MNSIIWLIFVATLAFTCTIPTSGLKCAVCNTSYNGLKECKDGLAGVKECTIKSAQNRKHHEDYLTMAKNGGVKSKLFCSKNVDVNTLITRDCVVTPFENLNKTGCVDTPSLHAGLSDVGILCLCDTDQCNGAGQVRNWNGLSVLLPFVICNAH